MLGYEVMRRSYKEELKKGVRKELESQMFHP